MAEAFIVRKGGVATDSTAAPTITIVTEAADGVTFTLTNNDDNTALISYEVDGNRDVISLAAAATSSNITVALDVGTYTLSTFATVVGEVATSATASVEITLPSYELLYSETVATAVTEIDITGLSIGKDDTLRLVYTFDGVSGTASIFRFMPNNQTTNTNYHHQLLRGAGSSIATEKTNSADCVFASLGTEASGFADIKVSNNDRFVVQSQFVRNIGSAASSVENWNYNVVGSGFTLTSITSLKILSTVTNGIGVGSKIALYKVTGGAA